MLGSEQDRNPVRPRGGNDRHVEAPARILWPLHGAPGLRLRRRSSSACTGRWAGSTEISRAGRTGPVQSGALQPRRLQGLRQLALQVFVFRRVGRTPGADQYVGPCLRGVEPRQHVPPADLPQPSLDQVTIDDPVAVLRNDSPEPGTRSGGRREEDVKIRRPPALPPLEQRLDIGAARDARLPRKRLSPGPRCAAYFPPTFTTSLARPRRRRRLSALHPPFVFMRARNPCLLTRFRLRGLYVGFMAWSPVQ